MAAKEIRSLNRVNESTGNTEMFYPATTTDAVADRTRQKSLADILDDLEDNSGAYDISAAHNNATYADLAAALGVNGANVPAAVRKGGMSVKFVLTSDNKYVQCRYVGTSTANADIANVANWVNVEEEVNFVREETNVFKFVQGGYNYQTGDFNPSITDRITSSYLKLADIKGQTIQMPQGYLGYLVGFNAQKEFITPTWSLPDAANYIDINDSYAFTDSVKFVRVCVKTSDSSTIDLNDANEFPAKYALFSNSIYGVREDIDILQERLSCLCLKYRQGGINYQTGASSPTASDYCTTVYFIPIDILKRSELKFKNGYSGYLVGYDSNKTFVPPTWDFPGAKADIKELEDYNFTSDVKYAKVCIKTPDQSILTPVNAVKYTEVITDAFLNRNVDALKNEIRKIESNLTVLNPYDFSNAIIIDNYWPTDNKWKKYNGFKSAVIELDKIDNNAVKITATSIQDGGGYIYFLKTYTEPTGNEYVPDFSETYPSRVTIGAGETFTTEIPSDCHYIAFGIKNSLGDITPSVDFFYAGAVDIKQLRTDVDNLQGHVFDFEQGGINYTTGNESFNLAYCKTDYILLSELEGKSLVCEEGYACYLVGYDSSKSFVSPTWSLPEAKQVVNVNTDYAFTSSVQYVKIVIKSIDGSNLTPEVAFRYISLKDGKHYNAYQPIVRKSFMINTAYSLAVASDSVASVQDAENYGEDWMVLMLPESYDPNGEPTRLVIGCHGGGGTVSSSGSQTETYDIYKYLVSKGYAVMDCGGMPLSYAQANQVDWYRVMGCYFALNSYQKAYDWIIENYNIKRDGVFLTGGSNGGLTSNNIYNHTNIPIIAMAGMSPLISMENAWDLTSGHSSSTGTYSAYQNRANIIKIYGINADISTQEKLNALTYEGANVAEYVCGFDPMYVNCIKDDDGNYAKIHKVPYKIWMPVDDPVIELSKVREFVARIKRGGGYAVLREMESGGHSPENAGTVVGTFTYLGNTYNIYPAMEELRMWFDRFN